MIVDKNHNVATTKVYNPYDGGQLFLYIIFMQCIKCQHKCIKKLPAGNNFEFHGKFFENVVHNVNFSNDLMHMVQMIVFMKQNTSCMLLKIMYFINSIRK